MRLDFNIVFVDDEYDPNKGCDHLDELIDTINNHLLGKGFNFHAKCFPSIDSCLKSGLDNKKIDLYISDYNLKQKETGIDLYLKLKDKFTCSYMLYSKADNEDILKQLIQELQKELQKEQNKEYSNPNLFSRFSFVSRSKGGTIWHETITDLLDHLISIREEINTLRGLFAHITAKMHQQLKNIPQVTKQLNMLQNFEEESFGKAIEIARTEQVISGDLKKWLNTQRLRRNDIIHNDEEYDSTVGEYYIPIIKSEKINNPKGFYLQDFIQLRTMLKNTQERLNIELNK